MNAKVQIDSELREAEGQPKGLIRGWNANDIESWPCFAWTNANNCTACEWKYLIRKAKQEIQE